MQNSEILDVISKIHDSFTSGSSNHRQLLINSNLTLKSPDCFFPFFRKKVEVPPHQTHSRLSAFLLKCVYVRKQQQQKKDDKKLPFHHIHIMYTIE